MYRFDRLCGWPRRPKAELLTTPVDIDRDDEIRLAIEERAADLAPLLHDPNTYFYVCGLKSMEEGVVLALRDIAQAAGLDWESVAQSQRREGLLHLETY